MSEISAISTSQRLTSQVKVTLESTPRETCVDAALEMAEMQQLEVTMEQINHAFVLIKEIRASLELALKDL